MLTFHLQNRNLLRYSAAALAAGALACVSLLARAQEADSVPKVDWNAAKQFWCFKSPVAYRRPVVKNKQWSRRAVDAFILAALEREKLSPAADADKRTLIRRLTLDLTGLPATPEETDSFLGNTRRDSYVTLVERLLASPRYGERMGSMWLPLARFGEDQAHQVGSDTKFFYPNAYKYRNWVIDAFNRDLPYNQFIKLQLAADRYLEVRPTSAPEATEEGDVPESEADKLSAQRPPLNAPNPTDLAALGFLGLGPKYYNRGKIEVMADEWEDRVDTVSRTFLGLTVACARCHDHKFEPVTQRDYYALAGVFASTRMINRRPDGLAEKTNVMADKMDSNTLHVVEDGPPSNLNVFLRGNPESKGPVADRRFLQVLSPAEPQPFKDGSGRKELAELIADRRNPLTARVIVNRVWGLFFGQPLVDTPSNLGRSGSTPTHPELLDDLAVRFMDNGWSIKWLVREIVHSSTYRQASNAGGQKEVGQVRLVGQNAPDAANRLLARMPRRRLSVEQWRDSVLFVAGNLKWEGGKSAELSDPANNLRTVYGYVSRLKLNDFLALFDYPDANVHAEKRSVTTTATQKLFMLNSPFIVTQADALAARLTSEAPENDESRIKRAYKLLFSREPAKSEVEIALEFLRRPEAPQMKRLAQYSQILLASNEMLYLD